MKSIVVTVALVILVISFPLAGCGNTQTAPLPGDDTGQDNNLSANPQRIVSLVPVVTEVLVALEASKKVVGLDDFSYWPPASAPVVRLGEPSLRGDVISPRLGIDTSAVIGLRPDLVIASSGTLARNVGGAPGSSQVLVSSLKKAGITTVSIEPFEGVTGTLKQLIALGTITGESGKVNRVVAGYQSRKQAVVESVQNLPKVRVVLAWGRGGGPPAPGVPLADNDPLNELVQLAGGVNVFTSSPGDKQLLAKFTEDPFTLEPYVSKNPEVILVVGSLDQWRLDQPDWQRVDAVKKGRVHALGAITPLTVMDRLEEVARRLHPGIEFKVSDKDNVPPVIFYAGTKMVNCYPGLKYPIRTDRPLTVLKGVVESVPGNRMDPIYGVSINGLMLSDPETGEIIRNTGKNLSPAIGREVSVTGYPGETNDTVPTGARESKLKFYVVDVSGWQYVCGNVVTGTGSVNAQQAGYWFEKGTVKGGIADPDYPYKTDKKIVTLSGTVRTGEGRPDKDEYDRFLTLGMRKSISVDGKHLFDLKTGKQISEFDLFYPSLIGKNVVITGYPEPAASVAYHQQAYPEGKISVKFDNVFYVSEIRGWQRLQFTDVSDNRTVFYWSEALN